MFRGSLKTSTGKIDTIQVNLNNEGWGNLPLNNVFEPIVKLKEGGNTIRFRIKGNTGKWSPIEERYVRCILLSTLNISFTMKGDGPKECYVPNGNLRAYYFKWFSPINPRFLKLVIEDGSQKVLKICDLSNNEYLPTKMGENTFCLFLQCGAINKGGIDLCSCADPEDNYYSYFKLISGPAQSTKQLINFSTHKEWEKMSNREKEENKCKCEE